MNKPATVHPTIERPLWQQQLSQCLRTASELLQHTALTHIDATGLQSADKLFATRVPREYLARAQPSLHDPLLLQVLPSERETDTLPGYSTAPLHEEEHMPVPGLLHKYHGRVLLIATGACPIHCRYCFRRHFPYSEANSRSRNWQPVLDYIHNDHSIREVILSGGDPLTLPDSTLASLSESLQSIPHLTRIRIHTRMPAVIPSRICSELIEWLTSSRLTTSIVMHINHAQEIDDEVRQAFSRLRQKGITLLNQSVLLKNVNDNADTLIKLSEALFAAGVMPYYLHQLDRVDGAAHFEVDDCVATKLVEKMRKHLPGYLVPKLVRELPGEASKTALA